MPIVHVPLLARQRALHDAPRGMERFQSYLDLVLNEGRDDVRLLPLLAANPMGREHVAARLDELLAFDAEGLAAAAVAAALPRTQVEGDFEHGLVVLDDVRGGWTNRITNDVALRFELAGSQKRRWITSGLWVSETASPARLRATVLASIARLAWWQRHGRPASLAEMMAQEGQALAFAGEPLGLDAADRAYTREVLAPLRSSTALPVQIAALYGDGAAQSLGYTPLGVSANAGFAVAHAEALGVL